MQFVWSAVTNPVTQTTHKPNDGTDICEDDNDSTSIDSIINFDGDGGYCSEQDEAPTETARIIGSDISPPSQSAAGAFTSFLGTDLHIRPTTHQAATVNTTIPTRCPSRRTSKRIRSTLGVNMLSHFTEDASGLASQDYSVIFETEPDDEINDSIANQVTGKEMHPSIGEGVVEARFTHDRGIFDDDGSSDDGTEYKSTKNAQPLPPLPPNNSIPLTFGSSLTRQRSELFLRDSLSSNRQTTTSSASSTSFDYAHCFILELFYLCNRPGLPLSFFDQLIKVIRKWQRIGLKLDSDIDFHSISRDQVMALLMEQTGIPPPRETVVAIESSRPKENLAAHQLPRQVTSVVCFDLIHAFMHQMSDDHIFSDLDKLVILPSNRWNQTSFPATCCVGEVIPAQECQEYLRMRGAVSGVDLVVPIILYEDEISTTQNQRLGVTPVLMANGIIKAEHRYTERNVRPLGLIPRFDKRTKAQKEVDGGRKAGKGRSVRNYHVCHDIILQEVRRLQDYLSTNPTVVRLGNELRKVFVHAPVIFFIGDAKAMDILAGRYASYIDSGRLSRFCDVKSNQAAIPGHVCQEVLVGHVRPHVDVIFDTSSTKAQQKNAAVILKRLCTHHLQNSIWQIDCGMQPRLPLPHDSMHILTTIMSTTYKLFVSPLSATERAKLDITVNEMIGPLRSGEQQNFPRVFFSHGVTSVTMLTSTEWVGTLLLMLMMLNTAKGRSVLDECLLRSKVRQMIERGHQRKQKIDQNGDQLEIPPTNEVSSADVIDVFEMLLMFHAFCEYGNNPSLGPPQQGSILRWNENPTANEKRLRCFITRMQKKISEKFPRATGAGWGTQKFHEMLHFPRNITMYGWIYQYLAAWGERLLKTYGKEPTNTVRKQHNDQFIVDVGKRIHEREVMESSLIAAGMSDVLRKSSRLNDSAGIQTAKVEELSQRIGPPGSGRPTWTVYQKRPQYSIETGDSGNLLRCKWLGRENGKKPRVEMPQIIVEWLVKWMSPDSMIEGYTEFVINDDRNNEAVTIRCHPSYRGTHHFDYCLAEFPDHHGAPHNCRELSGMTQPRHFPVRVLAIIANPDHDGEKPENTNDNPTYLCLVHSSKKLVHATKLTEQWAMEYDRRTIQMPPMDDNLNILDSGDRWCDAFVPRLYLIHPSQLRRRILVCQENPTIKSFIPRNPKPKSATTRRREDNAEIADDPIDVAPSVAGHSTNIVYVRDRKSFWAQILSQVVDDN